MVFAGMIARTEHVRLLLVEDSDDDAALVLRQLERAGFVVTARRVQTAPDLEAALDEPVDIVLCDYTMPKLDAPTALGIVRSRSADLPFIVVSGTVGEDTAVEVMRAGANDYLLKGNLTRLGPAVRREIGDGRTRAESRRADRERHEAEASFRLIIESSPDLIVVHRAGTIVYANPKTVERLGWGDASALSGQALAMIVMEDDVRAAAPLAEAANEGSSRPAPIAQRWRRREGDAIAVEVVEGAVVFEGEPATVSLARDLTERNQIAATMIEMDRMAAIGILAAGVGHEINNPLAYVLANLEFVTSELEVIVGELSADSHERLATRITDVMQALADTNHGADRVRSIVGDLRTFSRGDDESMMLVDVREVLDSSLRMAAVQLRQRATVVKNYASEVAPVLVNESRLGQLFLNLVVNAAQALPDGAPDDNRIAITAREEDGFVHVEIADTGGGIAADVLPRIFEPFFTTKPVGQGTGLGLSICKRIVVQLGGTITVTSQPGVGTTFVVRLPRANAIAEPRPSAPSPVPPSSGKRASIMCVDDEPALGLALKRVLDAEHDVVVITDAVEALARVKSGEHFDLLLCDLMMPGMSGMDLHAELARTEPKLAGRMVFLTGGAFTARARDFLEVVPNPRLEKPIGLAALRAAIKGSLEAH
jgi:PAS domain S-box-containing protein